MKNTDPSKLSFTNTLLIILFLSFSYSLTAFFTHSFSWLTLIIIDFAMFVFVFFSFKYTLEKFIYQKIKLVYKTIYNLKRQKGAKLEKFDFESNTIESINQEVMEWGENKKMEIERLEKNEIYRREFIGNIYHELKTPIFNIQGYVLTLLDGGLEDPSINREYLLRTDKSTNRMIAIVEDLEIISNMETSQIKLAHTKFDIVDLTKDVFESLEVKARKRKKHFRLAGKYEKPIMVLGDKKWIRQVLVNLIDNSLKYGATKEGKTEVSFFDMDENILIEITDDGPGISPNEIPRVFERFYRTQSARNTVKSGTGLGLSIVKHIIEAHEQTVNVRSRLDVGTTFAFTLKKG